MSKIILPRTDDSGNYYLSYSQIKDWKSDRRKYIREYFMGEKSDNEGLQKYGDFGNKVGEAFENDDYSAFEPDEIEFLKTVPRFDEFEREIRLNMDGFYLKGYIDTNTKPEVISEDSVPMKWIRKIADYKTGDVEKKGSSKIDYSSCDYLQVEIYAAGLRQEFGKAPKEASVLLLGRSGNAFKNEELKLTKEFIEIEKKITDKRLDEVEQEVQRVAEEISEYYQVFLQMNKVI